MDYDVELDSELTWESCHYVKNCGLRRIGFLQIISPAKNNQLRGNAVAQQKLGIIRQVISTEDVEIAPIFKTDHLELVGYEPESGFADLNSVTNSYNLHAKENRTILTQYCEVNGIRVIGGEEVVVESNGGSFDAPL
jgi:glycine/D-amino acid oxidase-like deaminating enzyme